MKYLRENSSTYYKTHIILNLSIYMCLLNYSNGFHTRIEALMTSSSIDYVAVVMFIVTVGTLLEVKHGDTRSIMILTWWLIKHKVLYKSQTRVCVFNFAFLMSITKWQRYSGGQFFFNFKDKYYWMLIFVFNTVLPLLWLVSHPYQSDQISPLAHLQPTSQLCINGRIKDS